MKLIELLESRLELINPMKKSGIDLNISVDDFVKKYDLEFLWNIDKLGKKRLYILSQLLKEKGFIIPNKLSLIQVLIDNGIYKAAINTFGRESQVDMLIEEMAELTQALLKVRRNPNDENVLDNLHEEFADVEICMAQIKTLMVQKYIDQHKQKKLLRLQYRISKHK